MIFVEGRRLVVDRINDHQSAACLLRTLHDQLKRPNQQRTTEAVALKALVERQLRKQDRRAPLGRSPTNLGRERLTLDKMGAMAQQPTTAPFVESTSTYVRVPWPVALRACSFSQSSSGVFPHANCSRTCLARRALA
jgi:hypothetical protein